MVPAPLPLPTNTKPKKVSTAIDLAAGRRGRSRIGRTDFQLDSRNHNHVSLTTSIDATQRSTKHKHLRVSRVRFSKNQRQSSRLLSSQERYDRCTRVCTQCQHLTKTLRATRRPHITPHKPAHHGGNDQSTQSP